MAFYISGPKHLFETTEISTHPNSTQPEIRVNRIRDNESQLYIIDTAKKSSYSVLGVLLPAQWIEENVKTLHDRPS